MVVGRFSSLFLIALGVACGRQSPRGERAAPEVMSAPSVVASIVSNSATSLRDGDVIFQESTSRQSEMVRALTGSEWTHMGVIFLDAGDPMVLEAVSPVRYTPLSDWIARGRNRRHVVRRLRDADVRLQPDVIRKMRVVAAGWLGRPYDLQFRWDDDALYCSELAYKLFDRGAGIRVGRLEHARDMNLADDEVQRALGARFARGRFNPDESVVTPVSIFDDDQFVTIR